MSTTSPEHVVKALENHDAQSAAGHLVSMAVAYKGVESMPLALLSGHVKTALLMMHAEESTTDNSSLCIFVFFETSITVDRFISQNILYKIARLIADQICQYIISSK